MHPRTLDALRYLYPTAQAPQSWTIANDGKEKRLVKWNLPGSPPTDAEIDALIPAMDAAQAMAEKQKQIDAIENQYPITQRALRETIILLSNLAPEIRLTPVFEVATQAEALIGPIRSDIK